MPVELRIGSWEKAMQWGAKGKKMLDSTDVYHQGIARDEVVAFPSPQSVLASLPPPLPSVLLPASGPHAQVGPTGKDTFLMP